MGTTNFDVLDVSSFSEGTVKKAFSPALAALGMGPKKMALARGISRAGGRLPAVMSAPPTIATPTLGDSSTQIAGGTNFWFADDASRYTFLRANWQNRNPAGYPDQLYWWAPAVTGSLGKPQSPGTNALARFWSSAADLEICTISSQSGYVLLVDGQPVRATPLADVRGNGDSYLQRITWGDGSATNRRLRLYEIAMVSNGWLRGIRTLAADAPFPAPLSGDGLRVLVHGDSYVGGANTQSAYTYSRLGDKIGYLLGQTDTRSSGVGSTGFIAAPNLGGDIGQTTTFGQRVDADVIAAAPDVIVELGGLNDNGQSRAAEEAAVTDWLSRVTAALPNVLIFMTGPMSAGTNGNTSASLQAIRDAKKAAAAKFTRNVVFIDNIAEQWTRGTGRVGATTGDGNADIVTGTDGVHPSDFGEDYLARRVVDAIASRLPQALQ